MSERMQLLKFASLPRPKSDAKSPPSPDLINWAIELYTFSLLSHFRELLRSFLFLVENGHVAASITICRTMFEMAAHVYYVNKHVKQYLESNELEQTWNFLLEIQQGSRYMQEYSGELDYEISPHISKIISCYNEFLQNGYSSKRYSFLSEYSHPGPFAFGQHYEGDYAFNCILFVPPPQDASKAPLAAAISSTCTVFLFINSLLFLAEEKEVSQQLIGFSEDLVKSYRG